LASKSQNAAQLSKDVLNSALSNIATIKQQAATRQNMLDQWAVNTSQSLGDLKSKFQALQSPVYQLPQAQQLGGLNTGVDSSGNYYPGTNGTDQTQKLPWQL
jgi:hypothetical protein